MLHTVNQRNIIHIIDADNPYEGGHDIACVKELQVDVANKRVSPTYTKF